jgi:hypothetical protein
MDDRFRRNLWWSCAFPLFYNLTYADLKGAFILMPSAQKDHIAHQQHPHEPKQPGGAQLTAQEKTDNVKNHKVEELAKKSEGDFRSEDLAAAKKEGLVSLTPNT